MPVVRSILRCALAACLVMAVMTAPSENARAAEKKPAGAGKKNATSDEYGPWDVKIPGKFRGRGYSLRIDDEMIPLEGDHITIKGSDYRERIELVDASGRMHSQDTAYVDQYIFDFVDTRAWRIGLHMGGTSVNGENFRNILQDSQLNEFSVDVNWHEGPLGILVTLASQSSEHEHDDNITSTFSSSQTRIEAAWELVPLRNSSGSLKRLHALVHGGLLSARNHVSISDGEVDLESSDTSVGPVAGVDLMYPFYSFWFSLRTYMSYQHMEFKEFDLKFHAVQRGALFGGHYAF